MKELWRINAWVSTALLLCLCVLLPYNFYTAYSDRQLAAAAQPVSGVVERQEEIACRSHSGRHTTKHYRCSAAIIAAVDVEPPWTGRVLIDTTRASEQERARLLALKRLVSLKPGDAASLHAIWRDGQVEYISEHRLAAMKRAGTPEQDGELYAVTALTLLFVLNIIWLWRRGEIETPQLLGRQRRGWRWRRP